MNVDEEKILEYLRKIKDADPKEYQWLIELIFDAYVDYNWNDFDSLIRVDGKAYRCKCGSNVFTVSKNKKFARCNGCLTIYGAE